MPTTRQTPVGAFLEDGYQSLITFAADPDVSLWEKSVTPGGIDGGDKIPTTTQHNSAWRTYAARQLKEMTDGGITCAYDVQVYTQIIALVNVETLITVTFPDGSTMDAYGYLKSFVPGALEEGSPPEAEVVVVFTNRHPTTRVETAPAVVDNGT